MGNAAFYYYPAGSSAGLETIDLGEGVSDIQVDPIRSAETAFTMSGRMYRTVETARLKVTITNERFSSSTIAESLQSMSSHLELGGAVAFTADTAKVWAGFSRASPTRGDLTIDTWGNAFSALSAGALASTDVLAIQSPNPAHYVEYCRVASVTLDVITLSSAIRYNHPESLTLVRYRDFYPILRMPADGLGSAFVTHDHRITYTLDLVLCDDLPSIYDYASESDGDSGLTSITVIDALLGNQSGGTTPYPGTPDASVPSIALPGMSKRLIGL